MYLKGRRNLLLMPKSHCSNKYRPLFQLKNPSPSCNPTPLKIILTTTGTQVTIPNMELTGELPELKQVEEINQMDTVHYSSLLELINPRCD